MVIHVCVNSRGVFPPLETLAVKAVVAESCEDAVNGLVHSLQAHGAFWQLGQLHYWQTGSLGGGGGGGWIRERKRICYLGSKVCSLPLFWLKMIINEKCCISVRLRWPT